MRPGLSAERVTFRERVSFTPSQTTLADGRAFEVARVVAPATGILVLERVGCYLTVQALDGGGAPIAGSQFTTTADSDPLALPRVHPVGGQDFTVRWRLLVEHHDASANGQEPAVIFAAPLQFLPHYGYQAGQLPREWADLRYTWQSRYTDGHQAVYMSGSMARLFAIVAGGDAIWSFRVGGILAGYYQEAGRRGAALANATVRE